MVVSCMGTYGVGRVTKTGNSIVATRAKTSEVLIELPIRSLQ